MVNGDVLATTVVQLATVGVAAFGAWRCIRLQRFTTDGRLTNLAWFFGLFATAVLLGAAWQWHYGAPDADPFGAGARFVAFRGEGNATAPGNESAFFDQVTGPRGFRPHGDERVNVVLAGHHALMLASLVVAVVAFGRKHPPQATVALAAAPLWVPFVFIGDLVPAMLAFEAGLTLYLAARALVNHVERRSPGAVQVALGFLLFFLGHLLFYLSHRPGYARTGLGDVLGLVGIVLLVQVLPGKQ